MSAGTGCDRDNTVRALIDRFAREAIVDDVVEDEPAICVHGAVEVFARAERRDNDRNLVLDAHCEVVLETIVGAVYDLVYRERCRGSLRMGAIVRCERSRDALQPRLELRGRPRVERRKRADDAGRALGDHELGTRDDEERRRDDRQREPPAHERGECLTRGCGHQSFSGRDLRNPYAK